MNQNFPFNEVTTDRPLRRNDVVTSRARFINGGYMMGRVWKRLDEHRVVVIDCGQNVTVYQDNELVLTDYRGLGGLPAGYRTVAYKTGWRPMPSLRRLKYLARRYNPHFGGKRWSKANQKEALLFIPEELSIQ